MFALGVRFDPGQQLFQQPPARQLEGPRGAFKPFEELRANERDDLLLPPLVEFAELGGFLVSTPIRQGVVDAEDKERLVLVESAFHAVEESAVGGL